jgi:HK97 family phage major capsid protein
MKLKELLEQFEQKQKDQKALLDKGEGLSAAEISTVKALDGELDVLEGQIKELRSFEDLQAKATRRQDWLTQPINPLPLPAGPPESKDGSPIPVYARLGRGRAKHFKKDEQSGKSGEEMAYRFGMWALACASAKPNAHAMNWCQEHGVKVMYEGWNESGGALVPEEFEQTLIDLREQYGIFRQYAEIVTMGRDTRLIPRRTGGVTVYAVAEGAAITASDLAFDFVQLVAKKFAALGKLSSELNEDSILDFGDRLAFEFGYGFAKKEDECGFVGDGTQTYHNIVGVTRALTALSGTIANIAGLVVASGNVFSAFTLADHERVVARLPQYADTLRARWYCHRSYYFETMMRLALAAGGTTAAEVIAGTREFRFLGYPVTITQTMPKTDANSQVAVVLGDLYLAAALGDRRENRIAMSEHSDFANDLIAVRGTTRLDINVHDVGNADATAGNREPGPMVGLISAAS